MVTPLLERFVKGELEVTLGPQLMLTGGVLAVISAYGPWVTLVDGFRRHPVNGTDPGFDGRITLILALVALALTLPALLRRGPRALPLLVVPLGLAIAGVALSDANNGPAHVHVYTEWGLWLTVAGGLAIGVGAVLNHLGR